jgi:hypothetical protein
VSDVTDSQDTAKATYDSANAYYMYAYRALMLQFREEFNTVRNNLVPSMATVTSATWIANVKTKIDAEPAP